MPTTVVLVDDNRDFRKLTELRLRSFIPDLQVTACVTLAEGRAHFADANNSAPDLLILDHHLPDGVGLDLLQEEALQGIAVLAVSSDNDPKLPGSSMRAGATYFLSKNRVTEALFQPLVEGLIERNRLMRELQETRREALVVQTVRTLVDTLLHEINNPLGAILGGAYLLKNHQSISGDIKEASRLVEESGLRIKHVLDQLRSAISLQAVDKAEHTLFHVPGDKQWGGKKPS
jgi:DNA-binding NarL/FixJ family response regulator